MCVCIHLYISINVRQLWRKRDLRSSVSLRPLLKRDAVIIFWRRGIRNERFSRSFRSMWKDNSAENHRISLNCVRSPKFFRDIMSLGKDMEGCPYSHAYDESHRKSPRNIIACIYTHARARADAISREMSQRARLHQSLQSLQHTRVVHKYSFESSNSRSALHRAISPETMLM